MSLNSEEVLCSSLDEDSSFVHVSIKIEQINNQQVKSNTGKSEKTKIAFNYTEE